MVDTIIDKKGVNILLLDIRDDTVFTDYFLICNGENDRQIKAIADGIADQAKAKANVLPWGTEGEPTTGWVLLDYGDLVVHLFSPEMRDYYRLEDIWTNAHVVLSMQ